MSDSVTYDPFAGGEIELSFETTDVQRELWLATQMSVDANCSYNLTVLLEFPEEIDDLRFRSAMEQTANRHSSFRTTFSKDGEYFHIASEARIQLEVFEAATDDLLKAQIDLEATTPFDLLQGPLWRASILKFKSHSSVLITSHHIIADGWSTGIWLEDLAGHYAGSGVPGSAEPTQFQDLVRWLKSAEVVEQVQTDLAFWQDRFAKHETSVSLPSPNERQLRHDFRCGFIKHEISAELLARLAAYARSQKVTLSTLLTTAFSTYLSNISGKRDVVVGIPAAAQLDAGMLDLIGHCVNTLPFLAIIDNDLSFEAILEGTKKDLLDAYDHQKVTFGTLLKSTPALRERLATALVPIVFNVESSEFELSFGEVKPAISFLPRQFDNFDAMFNCAVHGDGLTIEVHYNLTLFDAVTMQARLQEFSNFLASVTEPERDNSVSVKQINSLSADQQAILAHFNDTARDFGPFTSLIAMIDAQSARAPEATAFIYNDTSLTYQSLDTKSRQVAAALQRRDIQPGDIIAVAIPRSLEMVVALLGIIKAGAAYLPVDTDLPINRVKYILDDADTRAIIVSEKRETPGLNAANVLMIEQALSEPVELFSTAYPSMNDLAYVIYTSGSTGNPKGVKVNHGSLWNLLKTLQQEPGFTQRDRFIGLTTLSFDISVLEIWLPLVLGGSSVIVDRRDSQDGRAISRIIEKNHVTVVQATPSSWNLILASDWQGGPGIKAIAGGEPVTPELVKKLTPLVDEFWNGYGPTEATVYTLFKRLRDDGSAISVGKPVANSRFYLLSATGCVLGPEVIGEMCIGGACLADGYLNRSELSDEKFRYHESCGETLYHTGDLGYVDAVSGELFCLGRMDDQVKLRGYRIELGEISSVFASRFGVDQAVALIIRQPGNDYLAILYRNQPDLTIDSVSAREAMRAYLPEYMLPAQILGIDEFVITPNGKIDKQAALKMAVNAQLASRSDSPVDEELSEIQDLVITVLRDKLGFPALSLYDNFFDAGGHSLLAMKAVMDLGELLEMELPVSLIFDFPLVNDFSAEVDALLRQELATSLSSSETP